MPHMRPEQLLEQPALAAQRESEALAAPGQEVLRVQPERQRPEQSFTPAVSLVTILERPF